jgi:hypothetical protein
MYNQAQFNTTGVNFPAFPTYSGAQNVLMAPTPMVPTPMAQVPMVQAPMAQAPVASSPAEAGSGSPAPMAGSKPNMKEFMDATGADFQTASEMLYGVVGSNTDTRDWGAIMSSGNPVTAAAQATGQMYNNPASTAFNLGRSTTDINLLGSDPTKEALKYNNPTGQAGIVQTPEGFALVSADGIALRGGYGTLEQAQQAGRMFGIGPAQNYAQGGAVQGYQRGGPPGTIYGGAGDDMLMGGSEEDTLPPVDPNAALEAMLNRYAPQTVTSEQIAAAAERRVAEQKAFEDILRSQLQGSDSEPMSKAEKYFRLAAAFGAPTKTGHFAENLSLVGQEMADQLAAKAQREREARERGLGVDLEIQKMRMAAAGEDFEALQGVQSEEAKYRRDVAKELLKEQMELENLKEGIDQDPNVQSSTPLPDQSGVLMTLRDGSVQVRTVGGDLLFGQDAMDFVKEAQERSAEYQRSIYEARREGTLGAEAAAAAPGQISLFNTIEFQVNDLLNDPYLPNMLGPMASRMPNITADAARVQSKMDQISGGAFLQARQLLKGGGAITDFESKKAEQAFLRMNEAMNTEDYTKAMNDFLDAVRAGLPKLEDADSGLSDEDLQYLGDN